VDDRGDGVDVLSGEVDEASGKTCLMERGMDALKVGAVDGGG
jgi:hypothetical protein